MKYRRRLPALTAASDYGDDDDFGGGSIEQHHSVYYPRTTSEGDDSMEEYEDTISGKRSATVSKQSAAKDAAMSDPRKVYVSNVPSRVTLKQLASFFTKFGRISS